MVVKAGKNAEDNKQAGLTEGVSSSPPSQTHRRLYHSTAGSRTSHDL